MDFSAKEIVVLVIGTGLAFASFKSDDPLIFFPCIGISWASFIYICVSNSGPIYARVLIALAISCLFVFLSFRTFGKAQTSSGPEVALRFVSPKSPGLVIVNSSGSLARDIKWIVVLWNMDLPDRDDPLPIPVSTFDWIKPHQEGGTQNLFGGANVAPLLKQGDRLFGSASVNCPDCVRGRTYIVYIVYGEGGWVSEVENEKTGGLMIPHNVKKETREEYFKNLEATVPNESRIPISER